MFGLFAKNPKKSRADSHATHRRFQLEHLEKRELMAYNIFAGSPAPMGPVQSADPHSALVAMPMASAAPVATAANDTTVSAAKKTTPAKVDLDATIEAGMVVPTQSKDLLNLLHFYGSERATVPTKLKNYGPDTAQGKVTVSIYLSTGKTVDNKAVKLGEKTVDISLGNNSTQWVLVETTVPTSLSVGTKYFLVSKITTTIKQSTINDVRSTDRQFEFVGTPTGNSSFFRPDAQGNIPYFDVIRDTINGKLMYDNPYQLNMPEIMIAEHEGSSLAPFINDKGMPTLATGINLLALSPQLTKAVATAVRNYHNTISSQPLSSNDQEIIDWLVEQAGISNIGPVISQSDATTLFNMGYTAREQMAVGLLGKAVWSQVNPPAKIAVMDMIYDRSIIESNVVASLKAKDYVRAGFDLLNTGSIGRDFLRVRAEYQNLVYSTRSTLGSIAGTF